MDSHNLTEKSLKFTKGFKDFIVHGKFMNLAIAVVIGQMFAKIISSLVADIIMPPVSLLFDLTSSFKDLKLKLINDVYISYGNFLQTVIEFLLLSFIIYAIFTLILRHKLEINNAGKNKDHTALLVKNLNQEILLLEEIKEILKKEPNNK